MLDLISRGSQGHGPVHLLLWGGAWVGSGLPPSSQDDDWAYSAFLFFYSGCLAFPCLC